MGDAPDQEATRDALPDMLLVPAEVVSQLAWLGHLPLLLNKPTLKLALSLHCQICGERFSCPTLLTGHLADRHSEVIRDLQDLTDLVAWLLFAEYAVFTTLRIITTLQITSAPCRYKSRI